MGNSYSQQNYLYFSEKRTLAILLSANYKASMKRKGQLRKMESTKIIRVERSIPVVQTVELLC